MSHLDSNLRSAEELFAKFYDSEGCRAFYFAAEFQLRPGEIDILDVGDPPKNYKKKEVIDEWFVGKREEADIDPAQILFAGKPGDCLLVTEDLDKITDAPLVMLQFIGMALERGSIVLGYDAPQRLRALAAWAAARGVKSRLVVWRQSVGEEQLGRYLSDPISFVLSSTSSASSRSQFIRSLGLDYPEDRESGKQVLDIKKIVDTLLIQSLTDTYYEMNGGRDG